MRRTFVSMLTGLITLVLLSACSTNVGNDDKAEQATDETDAGQAGAEQVDPQQAIASQVPNTDIFLFAIDSSSPAMITELIGNATARPGYDNQPAFVAGSNNFIFSSIQDGIQSDVFLFRDPGRTGRMPGKLVPLTTTSVSEYSPTPVSESAFVAVVVEQDGTQRLWRYDWETQNKEIVRPDIKGVGYFRLLSDTAMNAELNDASQAALFIVEDPLRLEFADMMGDMRRDIGINIGRALHQIPGTKTLSYVQHHEDESKLSELRAYDPASQQSKLLVTMPADVEDLAWIGDGTAVTVVNRKLMSWRPGQADWQPRAELPQDVPDKITRLAVNDSSTRLAVVAEFPAPKGNTE